MKVRTYADAESFLGSTQGALEANEAANSLMLGVCGRLVRHPERIQAAPCLKTVEDEEGLVLAVMMTPPHKLVVYRHRGDLREGARVLVQDLVGEGWEVPGVMGPSEVAEKVAETLRAVTGKGYRLERRQTVLELREVKSRVPERGRLRRATEADSEWVARGWYGFHEEIFGEADREEAGRAARFQIGEGNVYLWQDGRPVSMAMKTRPTRRGISVSAVYTPPEWRQRGYATACVGELSRMLLGAGRAFCALFVDVENEAANRLYRRIGYRSVCTYDEYLFSG